MEELYCKHKYLIKIRSTNWDEVKTKDYEDKDRPDAPSGQEWRKWEK